MSNTESSAIIRLIAQAQGQVLEVKTGNPDGGALDSADPGAASRRVARGTIRPQGRPPAATKPAPAPAPAAASTAAPLSIDVDVDSGFDAPSDPEVTDAVIERPVFAAALADGLSRRRRWRWVTAIGLLALAGGGLYLARGSILPLIQ